MGGPPDGLLRRLGRFKHGADDAVVGGVVGVGGGGIFDEPEPVRGVLHDDVFYQDDIEIGNVPAEEIAWVAPGDDLWREEIVRQGSGELGQILAAEAAPGFEILEHVLGGGDIEVGQLEEAELVREEEHARSLGKNLFKAEFPILRG